MEITINITGIEALTQALNNLAQALGKNDLPLTSVGSNSATGSNMQQVPAAHPNQAAAPAGNVVPPMRGMPFGQGVGTALPTSAMPQAYTQDQIAVAMTGLIDQGKQPLVMQILAQFGAMSLMQIPQERYPDLATQLRGAGAVI